MTRAVLDFAAHQPDIMLKHKPDFLQALTDKV